MNTKNFSYDLSSNGFTRKEKIFPILINIILSSSLLLVTLGLLFFMFISEINILFILLLLIVLFITILKLINAITSLGEERIYTFDFINKVVKSGVITNDDFTNFINSEESKAIDISKYDTILYGCKITKYKYDNAKKIHYRALKTKPLDININGEVIEIYPWVYPYNVGYNNYKTIKTTTNNFGTHNFIGFFLLNSETDELVFLMDCNYNQLNETFDFLMRNIKPNKIKSINYVNKKVINKIDEVY